MSDGIDGRLQRALSDRYAIERELERGGMAVVYLARDLRHHRRVAIKTLPPALAASVATERFLREIAVTANLQHPNILTLIDSGDADGLPYYVMPFVEGQSLRERLQRGGRLPVDEAVRIASEAADALAYAHEKGVIHRDIKPGNILISAGHAVVADFGIAAALDDAAIGRLTDTGVSLGSPAYMAPEQAMGEKALDPRTDVYCLGCVLYEMLAGRPAFEGPVASMVTRKVMGEITPLKSHRPDVPAAIENALTRAMATTPADRFPTATAFRLALDAALPRAAGGWSRARTLAAAAVVALALGASATWLVGRDRDRRWLLEDALPRIESYLDVADFESAYALVREAERRVPDSGELADLWTRMSWLVTIQSEPAGAMVYRQGYDADPDQWEPLGRTPLEAVKVPHGLSRIRLELEGYRPLFRALGGGHLNWAELRPVDHDLLLVGPETYVLDTDESLPLDMVRVSGWSAALGTNVVEARDFLLGRHEVTNEEFKAFVEAGGYQRPELWDPVVVRGDTLAWSEAQSLFVDRTGRPGPSTWEVGDHPEGQADFPVAGVSWYEAAAYARFRGRELPTAHHWDRALANAMFPWLLPASNFSGAQPRPVSEGRAMSHVGAFDLAGNAREWTSSALGDERIVLGGSWNDPYYIAGTKNTSAPPEDRSPGNGIRLAATQDEPEVAARLAAPITSRSTVASAVASQPVSDDVYAAYSRVFDYDRGPLDPSSDGVDSTRVWTRERVWFDAGYGGERVLLYLYLPTGGAPPYQTVVYWPGWDTFALDDVDGYFARQIDFIVKSGRAVAFPIYRGIFERRVGSARARAEFGTAEYRDNTIQTVKDLRRTIDYLETRAEIRRDRVAFFGYSWGGVNGPTAMAQEPRIRVGVIDIGLLPPMAATPEVDPVNALPRVQVPVLMLSGEFDPMVPADNSARYFALLGAPSSDKRHVIAMGGHFIPRQLLIRETLDWLDKYLGPVGR